jgi:hypothetical protein
LASKNKSPDIQQHTTSGKILGKLNHILAVAHDYIQMNCICCEIDSPRNNNDRDRPTQPHPKAFGRRESKHFGRGDKNINTLVSSTAQTA